jgi:hypothetical protein
LNGFFYVGSVVVLFKTRITVVVIVV